MSVCVVCVCVKNNYLRRGHPAVAQTTTTKTEQQQYSSSIADSGKGKRRYCMMLVTLVGCHMLTCVCRSHRGIICRVRSTRTTRNATTAGDDPRREPLFLLHCIRHAGVCHFVILQASNTNKRPNNISRHFISRHFTSYRCVVSLASFHSCHFTVVTLYNL